MTGKKFNFYCRSTLFRLCLNLTKRDRNCTWRFFSAFQIRFAVRRRMFSTRLIFSGWAPKMRDLTDFSCLICRLGKLLRQVHFCPHKKISPVKPMILRQLNRVISKTWGCTFLFEMNIFSNYNSFLAHSETLCFDCLCPSLFFSTNKQIMFFQSRTRRNELCGNH